MLPYLLLVAAFILSVYSQLMTKLRVLVHWSGANLSSDNLQYLIGIATSRLVLNAASVTFLAGVCCPFADQGPDPRYTISFMTLSFVRPVVANLFSGEPMVQLSDRNVVAGVTVSALAW